MNFPKAPSWRTVFIVGAIWNAVIAQCWWAVGFCLAVALILPYLAKLDRHLFGDAR